MTLTQPIQHQPTGRSRQGLLLVLHYILRYDLQVLMDEWTAHASPGPCIASLIFYTRLN